LSICDAFGDDAENFQLSGTIVFITVFDVIPGAALNCLITVSAVRYTESSD